MSKRLLATILLACLAAIFAATNTASADPPIARTDLDNDGLISILDITIAFNRSDPRSDVNGDGVSDGWDVIEVLRAFVRVNLNVGPTPTRTPVIELAPTATPVPPDTATAPAATTTETPVPPSPATATPTATHTPSLPAAATATFTRTPPLTNAITATAAAYATGTALAAPAAASSSTPTPTPKAPTAAPPPTATSTPAAGTRDKLKQPFASTSIWNMPIGSGAQYVATNIQVPNGWGMTVDPDLIFMNPNAPMTQVFYNGDAWDGGSRCAAQGALLFSVPMPSSYIQPGASPGFTPNNGAAMLMPDGRTIKQAQPLTRCSAGGIATAYDVKADVDIYGDGITGAHGGSGLSAIGGTIRMGELVPGGTIRHAIKINLNAEVEYSPGFRWPATQADSCSPSCYGGSTAALKPGALLALPVSLNINGLGLETQAAKQLAWTLQNYGGYVVDSTSWSVYAIETEEGPAGKVVDEFQSVWGFEMTPIARDNAWSRDMDRIFGALAVVNNNSASSIGGGGTPLQPLAPPIGN